MNVGVNLYNDKKYAEAAEAFAKVAEAEPNNRDALFNLANTYLALKDGPKLLAAAQKLSALEPLSENSLKLVGEGYKQTSKVDDAVKVAEQVLAPGGRAGHRLHTGRRRGDADRHRDRP
jgi:tetratricopeptide (TPR) repeat protein